MALEDKDKLEGGATGSTSASGAEDMGSNPVPRTSLEMWEEYRKHMKHYAETTVHLSFTKIGNPDLQAILAMGKDVVPLLLQDMVDDHNRFETFSIHGAFVVLRTLMGDESPEVPEQDKGRVMKIRKLWLDWGKEKGYL